MKNLKRKHFVFAAIALVILAYSISCYKNYNTNKKAGALKNDAVLTLPNATLQIEIANSNQERQKGLSNKKSIENNEGLLFVFDNLGEYGFWMKDMNFPIDIIWIADDGYVVHLETSVSSSTYPKVFTNTLPAKYVLEINSGLSETLGIFLGSKLDLSNIK